MFSRKKKKPEPAVATPKPEIRYSEPLDGSDLFDLFFHKETGLFGLEDELLKQKEKLDLETHVKTGLGQSGLGIDSIAGDDSNRAYEQLFNRYLEKAHELADYIATHHVDINVEIDSRGTSISEPQLRYTLTSPQFSNSSIKSQEDLNIALVAYIRLVNSLNKSAEQVGLTMEKVSNQLNLLAELNSPEYRVLFDHGFGTDDYRDQNVDIVESKVVIMNQLGGLHASLFDKNGKSISADKEYVNGIVIHPTTDHGGLIGDFRDLEENRGGLFLVNFHETYVGPVQSLDYEQKPYNQPRAFEPLKSWVPPLK
tara:strand:+ start:2411 stop:3343 length:933 start_codon:yes stop_codon:yes gene_type:complete